MYNDAEALERCLTKLDYLGIKALVIDGRFTDFPKMNNSDFSSDNTPEICKEHDAVYSINPPSREQDKLNYAFTLAKEFDYKVFMYCGADAYFEGDIDEFMLDLQRYYEQYAVEPTQLCVETKELQPDSKWNNTSTRQPRIILNYWKLEARHLHWTLFEKGIANTQPLAPVGEIVHGIKLYHDNTVRPQKRDDLMTKYQDGNVPREREMYMKHIVPKAFDKIKMMTWYLKKDGSYEEARIRFFKNEGEFTHLLLAIDDVHMPSGVICAFWDVLEERNNVMENLHLITAVWASKHKDKHFTLDPEGKYSVNMPKLPKIEALYSPRGIPDEPESVIVAPFTPGPVVCMDAYAVRLMDHIGSKLDFTAIISGLGLQFHADSRIRY